MIDAPFFKRCCFCRFADYRISSILCKVQLKERKGHSQVDEVSASDQIVPEISRYRSCSTSLHTSYYTWTCFKNSDRNVINFGYYSIQSVQMILQPWRDTLTKWWWIGGNCGQLDHKYMIWLELTLCCAEHMTFSSLQWRGSHYTYYIGSHWPGETTKFAILGRKSVWNLSICPFLISAFKWELGCLINLTCVF